MMQNGCCVSIASRVFWGLVFLLGACAPAPVLPTPTADFAGQGAVAPKQLATVFISPTPNAAEQQATRLASSPTPDGAATDGATPTPTVYVGVFLGDNPESLPVVNATRFAASGPPTITPVFARCPLDVDPIFGERWASEPLVDSSIGCPIEGVVPFGGTTQLFEDGVMYFRPTTGEIWAVVPGGPGRYWLVPQVPDVVQEPVSAPPGLQVPTLGFGAVWQSTPGVRDALGFAVTEEIEVNVFVQRFEGGTLLYDESTAQVFVLMINNDAFGPF